MSCPLPTEGFFNAINNGINVSAFERICNEFGIPTTSNFRQKYDPLNGFGSVRYYETVHEYHGLTMTSKKKLRQGKTFEKLPNGLPAVKIPASGKFGSGPGHTYTVEYTEQLFDHDPGYTDRSPDHTIYSIIGSFVLDSSNGFTRAGVSRINDSVRTYVWAILGAQAQARSTILGAGRAFDAQKQFLANIEDAVNSEVDLPSSIGRYQKTLQYARSKVDFVIGRGIYMLPSDMNLQVGMVNGYNNLIQIATSDMTLGYNAEVNEELSVPIPEPTPITDDFDPPPSSPSIPTPPSSPPPPLSPISTSSAASLADEPLTHDERKLSLVVVATAIGCFVLWLAK
jgi:hypothetical protein